LSRTLQSLKSAEHTPDRHTNRQLKSSDCSLASK